MTRNTTAKTNKVPPKAAKAKNDNMLIGITVNKEDDFSGWYQQIVTKGEMLDYYDVSGCYIMRPPSYFVWEQIQEWFNIRIKKLGVKNAYFPMFVSSRVLEKEKDHVEGFAPEVAWVTKAGNSDLEEPVAIRPTSETVMYPYYSKWVRSHRDLPLKLNQWNSVVRWEFKHPQPFLRTREFLWQEGHTAHLTAKEAEDEVMAILDNYEKIYSELLAVPVIKGKKSEKEKFAGALFTTTVEGFIPSTGRGIQGATSHCLGQNFSKMFDISVEDPNGGADKLFAWQNSWGLSTRVIGVMTMTHSDNKGLVLPPRVAHTQAIIIPCGLTAKLAAEKRAAVMDATAAIEKSLTDADVRVSSDTRDTYSPGWKFSDAELRGIPLRIEVGPRDVEQGKIVAVRRDNGEKIVMDIADLDKTVPELLETIQKDLFSKAKETFDKHVIKATTWDDFVKALNSGNLVLAPWSASVETEEWIKDNSARTVDPNNEADDKAPSMGAKSLCIPFEQPELAADALCVTGSGKKADNWCLFGRSY